MIYNVARSGLKKLKVPHADLIKPYVDVRKYPYDLNELIALTENAFKNTDCNSKRYQEIFDLELQYGRYK